ncbi:MAG: alpha/beta hydrolase [Chloroflexota bacterium]
MTNFIDLKYSSIAHTKVGSGPDLVFVHGWPVDSRTYRYVVPELSKHFTCHLIDLPGAGKTIWNQQTPISLKGHCETLHQIIEALNLDSYALVAHDSGGVFARYMGANDQSKVRGMILSNTDIPRYYSPTLKLLVNSAKLPGYNWLMRTLLRFPAFRLSKYFGRGMFYDLKKFEGEFGDFYIRPLYQDKKVLTGKLQLIYTWNWDFLDDLTSIHARIKAPIQFIWGKNDVIFPLTKGREMLSEFNTKTDFKVIKRSRLYVQEEQPEQFVQHALPFLKNCF